MKIATFEICIKPKHLDEIKKLTTKLEILCEKHDCSTEDITCVLEDFSNAILTTTREADIVKVQE